MKKTLSRFFYRVHRWLTPPPDGERKLVPTVPRPQQRGYSRHQSPVYLIVNTEGKAVRAFSTVDKAQTWIVRKQCMPRCKYEGCPCPRGFEVMELIVHGLADYWFDRLKIHVVIDPEEQPLEGYTVYQDAKDRRIELGGEIKLGEPCYSRSSIVVEGDGMPDDQELWQ